MIERRSLGWPITLGVLMIVFVILLTVGWVLLAVFGALGDKGWAPLFWTLLPIGSAMLACLLVGTVLYLVISIRSVRLTRRQSNFLDSVTHELKSPITSIKLYTQTLLRRPLSDEQRQRFLTEILEDCERLDRLITQILGVARLQRQPGAVSAERLDIPQVLQTICDGFLKKHGLEHDVLSRDFHPCYLIARHEELDLIVGNLLDNAFKYGGSPLQVVVRCTTTVTGGTEISVTDNGSGIPRSDRRRVFERFVRLGDELERKRPGTGLGLYIVRTLVQQRSGTVRIQTPPSGIGTRVEVRFPPKAVRSRGHANRPETTLAEMAAAQPHTVIKPKRKARPLADAAMDSTPPHSAADAPFPNADSPSNAET